MDEYLTLPLPSWMFKRIRFTFTCENCRRKKIEWVNKRHIKQKKYCKGCQKVATRIKFKRLHPGYNQEWKEKHYIAKPKKDVDIYWRNTINS